MEANCTTAISITHNSSVSCVPVLCSFAKKKKKKKPSKVVPVHYHKLTCTPNYLNKRKGLPRTITGQ